MFKSSGFTLIELMIVISIISILTLIGIISYTQVLKNGRDGQRKTDLVLLESALEQYRADLGFYPTTNTITSSSVIGRPFTNQMGWPVTNPPPPLKTYLSKIQGDVNTATPYVYKSYKDNNGTACDNSATKCFVYCLYANLEGPGSATLDPAICNTNKPTSPSTYNSVVTTP